MLKWSWNSWERIFFFFERRHASQTDQRFSFRDNRDEMFTTLDGGSAGSRPSFNDGTSLEMAAQDDTPHGDNGRTHTDSRCLPPPTTKKKREWHFCVPRSSFSIRREVSRRRGKRKKKIPEIVSRMDGTLSRSAFSSSQPPRGIRI